MSWYESHLGPFPFDEYSCFDSTTYFGIESYNYTLLRTDITTSEVAHEMGHTYFGGLVPCAYVHDSWNESLTQYVDSVLRQNDADQTLESAYRTISLNMPLTEMPVAEEYGGATYMRGAFVMRMLENEIGLDNIYKGLRALIADRRGKDTTWYDLRPYFEKASGQKLDWFWRQWVSGSTFPKLEITDVQGIPTTAGTRVLVTIRQSGTPDLFRLRFKVYAKGVTKTVSSVVTMNSPEAVFELNLGEAKAYRAGIETLGYVLTPRVPEAIVKQ
jgi:aminopeptidase N